MTSPIDYFTASEAHFISASRYDNSIIRDFLHLRRERDGGLSSEVSTPLEDYSSGLSDSFSSSQVSELSLRPKRRAVEEETPETDVVSFTLSQLLSPSPPQSGFEPILNTDSGESNPQVMPGSNMGMPMGGSAILSRYRRLMDDLEVSQGIHIARLPGVEAEESGTDENSFTESMLAIDVQEPDKHPRDLVKWLAEQFKRSRKTRNASIDGIVMSHGVSQTLEGSGPRRWNLRQKSHGSVKTNLEKKPSNMFARLMSHWRIPKKAESSPPLLVSRSPGDRFSSIF